MFDRLSGGYIIITQRQSFLKEENIMADERKNPCGDDLEIDEYLDGTICEIKEDEEEINDIKTPSTEQFDVDAPEAPKVIEDEYLGKSE